MDVMLFFCFIFHLSQAFLTQNVSTTIDFGRESSLTSLVKDPGSRSVTLATPYPLVSASP